MEKIFIENPCPYPLLKMDKCGSDFFCKSCKKSIIDLRHKSQIEIESYVGQNNCVILNEDQMTHQLKRSYYRTFMFQVLTLIAFIGFNVKPIHSQISQEPVKKHKKETKKSKLFKKKNKKPTKRMMGWL